MHWFIASSHDGSTAMLKPGLPSHAEETRQGAPYSVCVVLTLAALILGTVFDFGSLILCVLRCRPAVERLRERELAWLRDQSLAWTWTAPVRRRP